MKADYDKKIDEFKALLDKLRAIDKKIENDESPYLVVAELLAFGFINKTERVRKEFSLRQLDQLKSGIADGKTVMVAQEIIYPMMKKAITKIDNLIQQSEKQVKEEKPAANDPYQKYLSQLKDMGQESGLELAGASKSILPGEISTDEIYNSYFSMSALKLLDEHMETGQTPTPARRYLTVCFIDLVGFSTMSEIIDSMQVIEVLNTFFNRVCQTIKKHNGDIDKFIGDAMLIIFESAEDAVRCSVEIIHKDLDVINSKLEYLDIEEIRVHLGLHSGWVVQGNVGSDFRRETTVIGDGVNIAARVQGLTPPNELWVTDSTMTALGQIKSIFEPIGMRKLKGRAQEVMVYKHVRKVPPNRAVVIYEPNIHLHDTIREKMEMVGITDLSIATDIGQLQNMVKAQKVKAVVAGPSVDTSILGEMLTTIDKEGRKSLSTLPIIATKNEQSKIPLYEKLGLKVYVSLYKNESFEKVKNVLITENVKDIPKLKDVPKPVEHKLERKVPSFELPEELLEGHQIEPAEEETPVSDTIAVPESIPKHGSNITIHASENEINLHVDAVVGDAEMKELRANLSHLWKYQFHGKSIPFVFDLSGLDEAKVTKDYLKKLLNLLDFIGDQEKVSVRMEFGGNSPIEDWDRIKSRYKYQFLA